MNTTYSGNTRPYQKPYYNDRWESGDYYPNKERSDKLVPNELRVSSKSSLSYVVRSVLSILKDQNYPNCKVVARGTACPILRDVFQSMTKEYPQYDYDVTTTKSFNVYGQLVEELHLFISNEEGYSGQRF